MDIYLTESWSALDKVGVSKSCRVMRLLDLRSFELKSHVHETLNHIWKSLINVDMDAGKVVIKDALVGMFLVIWPQFQSLDNGKQYTGKGKDASLTGLQRTT